MNRWECDHPGCTVTAVGVGGAVGLRSVGWFFEYGPKLLCPAHRPDPTPCVQEGQSAEQAGKPCELCAAEAVARFWQKVHTLDEPRLSPPDLTWPPLASPHLAWPPEPNAVRRT